MMDNFMMWYFETYQDNETIGGPNINIIHNLYTVISRRPVQKHGDVKTCEGLYYIEIMCRIIC